MNVFPEQALRRLEVLARNGDAITTEQVREVLGLNAYQFARMVADDNFPHRQHIGRRWWVSAQQLLDFVLTWNRLAQALTITDVARLIRRTITTARRLAREPGFPAPLGQVNGRDRWARADILEWQRASMGGAKLPPDANGGPAKSRKKTPHGARTSGKPQKEKHASA